MRRVFILGLSALCLAFIAGSCIIPDRDIQVVTTTPCGEEYAAQTVGAYAYDGYDYPKPIKTKNTDEWLSKSYCLNAEQALEMTDPTSELAMDAIADIISECHMRAFEMGNLDSDMTCESTASIAYIGPCQEPAEGCSEAETGGADGGETGPTETETGAAEAADYFSLDLQAEITCTEHECTISQHLIDTALADPVGIGQDGTTATQVHDDRGTPWGFEIGGAHADNLGGALGLRDGDVVIAIDEQPTATQDDLVAAAAMLFAAQRVELTIVRAGETITRRYRRGE